jgi:hypothetical protein
MLVPAGSWHHPALPPCPLRDSHEGVVASTPTTPSLLGNQADGASRLILIAPLRASTLRRGLSARPRPEPSVRPSVRVLNVGMII